MSPNKAKLVVTETIRSVGSEFISCLGDQTAKTEKDLRHLMYKKRLKQLFAWKGNDKGDITKVYKIRNSREREKRSNNLLSVIRRKSLVRKQGGKEILNTCIECGVHCHRIFI